MNEKNHRLDDFFEMYGDMVFRQAYQVLKDHHAAEDIAQETFVRLSRDLDKLSDWMVRVWLLRTAKNLAIDHLRKGGKYKTVLGYDEDFRNVPADIFADPGILAEKKDESDRKIMALKNLSREKPEWFQILMMSEVDGIKNQEIANRLGISAALVSKRKERARKWLWDEYRRLEEE